MRLVIISDIHANLMALEAVLGDMPAADHVVCCGDLVEYYDQPNEVCALVRERGIACIRGNHDAYVTGALVPKVENRGAFRTDWTRETMAETHLRWLEGLGTEMQFHEGDRLLTVRHANPWDEETYLRADATAALERLRLKRSETLAVGHTHRPLLMPIGDGWLLNPGSVGQPRDGDARASYAVFDLTTGAVEHRRVGYDVALMQRRLEAQGWDPTITGLLSRTYKP